MSYTGWRPVDRIFRSNARINSIDTAKCIFSTKEWGSICKGDGTAQEFRDRLSKMEYAMSGACQACQDDIVRLAEEEEALDEGNILDLRGPDDGMGSRTSVDGGGE